MTGNRQPAEWHTKVSWSWPNSKGVGDSKTPRSHDEKHRTRIGNVLMPDRDWHTRQWGKNEVFTHQIAEEDCTVKSIHSKLAFLSDATANKSRISSRDRKTCQFLVICRCLIIGHHKYIYIYYFKYTIGFGTLFYPSGLTLLRQIQNGRWN